MKDILDSDIEVEKNKLNKIDFGLFLILSSIAIELILIVNSSYWFSCGINLIDLVVVGFLWILSVLIYQIFKNRLKRKKWILILLGCGINIFIGIMINGTVC